ncbi:MAG: hypothetical protein ABJB03_12110 [Rhodoglobus sp.]
MAPLGKGAKTTFWIDPRFIIGLLLVASSVGGVYAVVTAADTTVPAYTARDALSQGQVVHLDDLVESHVRLDGANDLYLLEGDVPAAGLVVTKPVAAGELVPASAVGAEAGQRFASVVLTLTSQLPGSVDAGSSVDLWSAKETKEGFGAPTVLVSSATVVRLVESEGLVVDKSVATVEVLVPKSKIARVLEAVANGDALSMVPVSIPAKG